MTNIRLLNWIIGGLILLLVLGFLATQVGGIAIRHQTGEPLRTITVAEPIIPGVMQQVQWNTQPGEDNQQVVLLFRSGTNEQLLGSSFLGSGVARVAFPCSGVSKGTLIIRDEKDQHVIGQQSVRLLPAGRECTTQPF